MAEEIPKLWFKPFPDEYLYLESTGAHRNWSKQCHQWIEDDRRKSSENLAVMRKQSWIDAIESIRNGLLIIGIGILILLIAQGSLLMIPEFFIMINCSAVASVVIGFITIFYRRKKGNGRAADSAGH